MLDKINDPIWRLNNLYKIVDKNGKLITFKENYHQQLINRDPSNHKLILKARQLGVSTARILRLFDKTIFNENQTSVILAHEQDSIRKLFRIVYRAYKFMDKRVQPRLPKGGGSMYEMFFPEVNSRIYCDLESRGDTIHNLHVSETGLMKDADRINATMDAVPLNGEITHESTPKGLNHFHDMWFNPDSNYKKFFFPWYSFSDYKLKTNRLDKTEDEIELIGKALKFYNIHITDEQIAFRRFKIQQKGGGMAGLRGFMEEYPEDERSCFLTSGNAIFNLFEITKMITDAPDPLRDTGPVKIYKQYDKTKDYVCGADCAEGVGGDSSVGIIIEVQTKQVAAVIRGNFKPYEFAHKLNDLCGHYQGGDRSYPKLAVERNNHGHAVLLELNEHINYPNLYHRPKGEDIDDIPGWVTDRITRPVMLNDFIHAVENNYLKLNDKELLNECLTLVNNDGKIEGAEGKHDDCIIACSIALQVALEVGTISNVYSDLESKILL